MKNANRLLTGFVLCALTLFAGCGQVRGDDSYRHFKRGAVAADHAMASQAGARMLALGGNAVDAAVAASFTLSVVRPYSCGLGGGGFMVIHLPDDPTHGFVEVAINYREHSPYGAGFYERTGKSSTVGGAAVAIPGTVRGLLHAHERYGTLDRATVLAPAIEAATNGFVVDEHYMQTASELIERFTDDPGMQERFALVWGLFLDGGRVRVGSRIVNPRQGRALAMIAKDGLDAWMGGEIGEAVVRAVNEAGGEIAVADLDIGETELLTPVEMMIDGKRFVMMRLPSSGGVTMGECLGILAARGYDFSKPIFGSDDERVHEVVEALKHAFADRSRYLADAKFVDVPVEAVLGEANAQRMAGMIDGRAHEPGYYGTSDALVVDGGTSHVSVVDPFGGAVAMTETINLGFGSLVGVDEFGFILNNEMDDFTTVRGKPNAFGLVQSDRNLPAVGKQPLSSMSPTIVLDADGRVIAVAGASGGPRIITGTMQVLLNALGSMNAAEAVAAPRLHHQWLPNRLEFEGGFDELLLGAMAERGHEVAERKAVGNVQLILRDRDGDGWQAASDPRKGGRPAGIDR